MENSRVEYEQRATAVCAIPNEGEVMLKARKTLLGLLVGCALAAIAVGSQAQDEGTAAEGALEPATTESALPEASEAAAPEAAEAAEAPPASGEATAAVKVVKPLPSEIMPLAAQSLLLDVVNTGERLIAVGDRGHVLASNEGKQWVQVQTPVRSALTAVTFADAKNGWAVGHDAVILHSADGGRSWNLQNFQPELEKPFLDVLFLDASHGFAVGAYALFYETLDGGQNWAEVNSEIRTDELHFNAISRLNNGDLLIAGEQGTLAISSDGGATWTKLTSPYESSMFGAVAHGDKGAVIFGLRGNVYFSADPRAGQWTRIDINTVASMFGGTVLPGGRVAMVGLNGAAVVVDPAGGEVSSFRSVAGTPLSGVIAVGESGLLTVGESGVQGVKLQ
jgi:photosystem II stability/assembly factor-like uncharacterized protein